MRKGIILGIGILIILLAMAGTASAKATGFGNLCSSCHVGPGYPTPFTGAGSYFNSTHRYNDTSITPPTCATCHVDVNTNFNLSTGTPNYTNSSLCKVCHQKKYDDWYSTMHRVMLSNNTSAQIMGLPLPANETWANITFVVVGKTSFRYLNNSGGFFKKYDTVAETFSDYYGNYTCGGCHTTGYNTTGGNQSGLVNITGTWSEPGITCENCHGPGGNGHQVTINKTGGDCNKCHYGNSRQGQALTNKHATGPAEESTSRTCTQCHSPYDRYMTGYAASLENAANVTCFVCHNPHGTTDDKYADLLSPGGFNNTSYAVVGDVKLGFFNGTASNVSRFNNGSTFTGTNASLTAGNDIYDNLSLIDLLYLGNSPKTYGTTLKDSSYGNGSIDLTGRPESEKLCSMCHYRHGLAHVKEVNLTHGRNNVTNSSEWATCTDCHNSGSKADHSFNAYNATNYPQSTCSKGTNCHVTSSENVALSNLSIVPIQTEWKASLHNNKEVGDFYINESNFDTTGNNNSSCSKCHSPTNWNPANESDIVKAEDFKGITCAVCHDIHDMGDSINKSGLKYSWYNRDASYSSGRYSANYTLMANTTELCGNCHASTRIGRSAPGWSDATTPIRTHGFPAKDIFVGSWKQSSMLKFECIDCHMYTKKNNATGYPLNDTSKIAGHSFTVNSTGLQASANCSGCHVNGTDIDTIQVVINKIQADTIAKHTTVNATVYAALASYNAYGGIKTLSADKIAQAYWNVRLVKSDASWGVHDPVGTNQLLDDALVLAEASNTSLGMAVTSNVDLITGWNLVSLNGTPADTSPSSVMNSVKANITVVWTYNATGAAWELYDPLMPSALNTLKSMVQGKGYWIYATQSCKWTV